jgi:Mn2+/Fe2+ NRAMP family transporter
MKAGGIFACTIPELRQMTMTQLFKLWHGCSPYSRHMIYLHIVILLACASVIFNAAMRLSESFLLDMVGLAIGLLLPPNIYFNVIFKNRRTELRQFIEQNWDEFRPK